MMAEARCDSKLICYDIEAAGDWSWVKILTASSQDGCGPPANQPTKNQSAARLNMQAAIGSQPAIRSALSAASCTGALLTDWL